MRSELELIQRIEQYLQNELSADEKILFESEMNSDPSLKEKTALQQEIMAGIHRVALRTQIQQAAKRFRIRSRWIKGGLTGIVILLITIAALYVAQRIQHHHSSGENGALPQYNEAGTTDWADADRNLKPQTFSINAATDTVIETRGGIVFAIPAGGFVDLQNHAVNGRIELVIKEALTSADILQAGLATRSGNQLLETGGMFLVDARKDHQVLKINPVSPLYAQVPTDTVRPGMQLFKGTRKPDGSVDWKDPKPLSTSLVPMDIMSLDFYPPDYLDSLSAWGYDASNKSFTDSLYFGFSRIARPMVAMEATDTIKKDQRSYSDLVNEHCGINPAKIQAIWSVAFQNTLLATREFEQRLHWIHQSQQADILDIYIEHMDKPLYFLDSVVAAHTTGDIQRAFSQFAARREGMVNVQAPTLQKLKEYYVRKTKLYTEAVAKTRLALLDKQARLEADAANAQYQHSINVSDRDLSNLQRELEINLKEAYRQLGKELTIRPATSPIYTVQVTSTGWSNVDRYVTESTFTRTTLNYTDPQSGANAVIKYMPASFQIHQSGEYHLLYVYLLPKQLTSFMKVSGDAGIYKEQLNELINYQLICIGYQGEQPYYYWMDKVDPKAYVDITLNKINPAALTIELNKRGSLHQSDELQEEIRYLQWEVRERQRVQLRIDEELLELNLTKLIFPCYSISAK